MILYSFSDWKFLIFINIALIFTVIFLERKNPATTLTWTMVLILFPALGFLCYILFSQDFARKPMFRSKQLNIEIYENYLDEKIEDYTESIKVDHNIEYKDYEDIINFHRNHSQSPLTTNNHVQLFFDGTEKFDQLKLDIVNATSSIHILYFVFNDDVLGKQILDLLIEKAKEGIEVRFLFDAFGSAITKRKSLIPLKKAGGQVCEFFPSLIPFLNLKANYRNHRKIVIIDGKIGYIGGFNIGDEYLGKKEKFGYWRDTHIKIIGDSVASIQTRFFLDWEFAAKENLPLNDKYFPNSNSVQGDANIQIVSSGPDSKDEHIKEGYIKLINYAKKTISIQTPYFIPDQALFTALKLAALSGVDVKIMIPCIPDHMFVHWASYSFLGDLLPYGIKAYTYQNGFLHSKTISIDGKACSVGTSNFDIRSFQLDFEINAFIYDQNITTIMDSAFQNDLSQSKEITRAYYDNRSIFIKLKESISRLLSPIL